MRQATVRLVEENAAGGKVREIFDDIKRTKGIDFVPNFWRALATSPDQLDLVWRQLKSLMHPEAAGRKSQLICGEVTAADRHQGRLRPPLLVGGGPSLTPIAFAAVSRPAERRRRRSNSARTLPVRMTA